MLDLAVARSAWRSMVTVRRAAFLVQDPSARADQPGRVAARRCLLRDRTGTHPPRQLCTDGPEAGGWQLGARSTAAWRPVRGGSGWMAGIGSWGPVVRQLGGPFVGVDVSVQALAAVFDQHPVVSHARGRTTGGRGASSSCGRWRATSCRTSCLCLLRHSRPSRGTSCASHLRHHRLDWFRSPFSPGTVGSRSARRCRRPTSLRRGPECSASSGGGRRR